MEVKYMLENKLGINNPIELANIEEKITKKKSIQLFENGMLDSFEVGTFKGLSQIHKFLFEDIYEFAREFDSLKNLKSLYSYSPNSFKVKFFFIFLRIFCNALLSSVLRYYNFYTFFSILYNRCKY